MPGRGPRSPAQPSVPALRVHGEAEAAPADLSVHVVVGPAHRPYHEVRAPRLDVRLWLAGGEILDFSQGTTTTVTISGGGLPNARTLTVAGTLPDGTALSSGTLSVDPARVAAAEAAAALSALAWVRCAPVTHTSSPLYASRHT